MTRDIYTPAYKVTSHSVSLLTWILTLGSKHKEDPAPRPNFLPKPARACFGLFYPPNSTPRFPKPTKNTHKEKSKRNYKYGIHIASHMARFIGLTALAMRSITVW